MAEKTDSPTTSGEQRVIIRTVGLKKSYIMKDVVTEALRGVNVEIFTGEFISVMGPSGSGKSTFFNMIGALDSPTTGRVFIDEVDVAATKSATSSRATTSSST
jgi:putative ABC transport system ATP-binding protein